MKRREIFETTTFQDPGRRKLGLVLVRSRLVFVRLRWWYICMFHIPSTVAMERLDFDSVKPPRLTPTIHGQERYIASLCLKLHFLNS